MLKCSAAPTQANNVPDCPAVLKLLDACPIAAILSRLPPRGLPRAPPHDAGDGSVAARSVRRALDDQNIDARVPPCELEDSGLILSPVATGNRATNLPRKRNALYFELW